MPDAAHPPSTAPAPRGVSAFLDGMVAFFEGVRFLLGRPQLILVVGIPFVLTILVFVVIAIFAFQYFSGWEEAFFADRTAWYWTWTGAEFVAWLLFILLFGGFCLLTFVTAGSLITSPFSDYLSQRVEAELLPGHEKSNGGIAQVARDVARSIKHEAIRLTIYLSLVIGGSPMLLVPLVGQIAFSVYMTYVSIRYLAWDGLDYCMARHRYRFREKMGFLRKRRSRTLGYGTICFVLLAIPFTTLFVLPLNAIGGSILFCRIVRSEGLLPERATD